jgi:hypothetical protein
MNDLIERLRAANPLPDCPEPSLDEVWRRIDLADAATGRATAHLNAGSRPPSGVRRVGTAALLSFSLAVVLGIVVLAALTLGHGHRHQRTASNQGSSVVVTRSSREQLLRSLEALRRPQDQADREALRIFGRGGLLPNYLSTHPLPFCGSLCEVQLQRRLSRSFMIPGSRYRAAIFPVAVTHTTRELRRGELAVVLSVKGPRMGIARSSAIPASGGTPAASGPVSADALRANGVVVSFEVRGSAEINRAAILVPDGVRNVVLENLTLTSPRTGTRLASLPTLSAPVRDDIALVTLKHMTASRLHIARDPDGPDGGFHRGKGCTLESTVYIVPATAQMLWKSASATRRSTIHFYAYIEAKPTPGQRFPSPRCGA